MSRIALVALAILPVVAATTFLASAPASSPARSQIYATTDWRLFQTKGISDTHGRYYATLGKEVKIKRGMTIEKQRSYFVMLHLMGGQEYQVDLQILVEGQLRPIHTQSLRQSASNGVLVPHMISIGGGNYSQAAGGKPFRLLGTVRHNGQQVAQLWVDDVKVK